jgi:hypothetical protein
MRYIEATVLILTTVAFSMGDNKFIYGVFSVRKGLHYSNKTTIEWGSNDFASSRVTVSMSTSCATYDCSQSCEDTKWYYDWNKLWGKIRCGYTNGNHDDSDRFVWRRCSDPTCALYVSGQNMIQLGAYRFAMNNSCSFV